MEKKKKRRRRIQEREREKKGQKNLGENLLSVDQLMRGSMVSNKATRKKKERRRGI